MSKSLMFCRMAFGLSIGLVLCMGCTKEEAADTLQQAEASAEEAANAIAADVGEVVKEGEEMASDAVEGTKDAVGDAVEKGKDITEQTVEEGKKLASELGEKAAGFLVPLKDGIGNLDEFKETPEDLKKAVSDLIQSIEGKAEDISLPESVTNALATIKEKLVALKDYLEGEVEQAEVNTRLEDLYETVKSGFGLSE